MTLKTAERFAGIDVMRGFAAFGVICIHAGLVVYNQTDAAVERVRLFFDFVVPFFLVAALFFAIQGEKTSSRGWREWMRGRASRLLVPYAVWSVIYLGLHILKLIWQSRRGQIGDLFQNPWALLLNGGSSLALFFLPLLFVGLLLVGALRSFIERAPVWVLSCALLVTVVSNQVVYVTGNSFDLDNTSGFEHAWPTTPGLIRCILVLLAHTLRCLPLIFVAALMVRFLAQSRDKQRCRPAITGGLMIAIYLAARLLVNGLYVPEFLVGAGVFFVGWALPVKSGQWTTIVGTFSFGVYLVHQVVQEAMQLLVHKWNEVPVLGVAGYLGVALLAYVLSMAVVGLASRGGPWLRRIFGLR